MVLTDMQRAEARAQLVREGYINSPPAMRYTEVELLTEAAVTERAHRNIAEAERDEARRGWARLFVAEIGVGGVLGEKRFVAEKWGRKVALALYPEAYLRERLAEFESPDDLAEVFAEWQREFDKEFPA